MGVAWSVAGVVGLLLLLVVYWSDGVASDIVDHVPRWKRDSEKDATPSKVQDGTPTKDVKMPKKPQSTGSINQTSVNKSR